MVRIKAYMAYASYAPEDVYAPLQLHQHSNQYFSYLPPKICQLPYSTHIPPQPFYSITNPAWASGMAYQGYAEVRPLTPCLPPPVTDTCSSPADPFAGFMFVQQVAVFSYKISFLCSLCVQQVAVFIYKIRVLTSPPLDEIS